MLVVLVRRPTELCWNGRIDATFCRAEESRKANTCCKAHSLAITPVLRGGSAPSSQLEMRHNVFLLLNAAPKRAWRCEHLQGFSLEKDEIPCYTRNINRRGLSLECPAELVADGTMPVTVLVPAALLNSKERWVPCEVED